MATVVTLLALPALWIVNRSTEDRPSAAPNVGAVGVDDVSGSGDPATVTTSDRRANLDRASETNSVFLSSNHRPVTARVPDIAVPTIDPGDVVRGSATFSRYVAPGQFCVGAGDVGETVTIRNVNNNRSTTCLVVERTDRVNPAAGTVVLERSTYLRIASASDAPVPIEISR